jgi:hypothetical protein
MPHWINGAQMSKKLQEAAKTRFVHRFTAEHVPAWYNGNAHSAGGKMYPHFASDADWLANTEFCLTKDGRRFNEAMKYCRSSPTWPKGRP